MAERRMFAKTIVMSDAFLDMPLSARCLYFTLGMFGDDDGFVNNPKSIMRQIGSTAEDLNTLLSNKFLLAFESGVIVIKHWRINNYLRNDRYHETKYIEERQQLYVEENGAYSLTKGERYTNGIPGGIPSIDKGSKDKVSIGKNRLDKGVDTTRSTRFVKPTITEIEAYCTENGINIDVQYFYNYYEANGWKVGRNSMKDWKATVRNWSRRESSTTPPHPISTGTVGRYEDGGN